MGAVGCSIIRLIRKGTKDRRGKAKQSKTKQNKTKQKNYYYCSRPLREREREAFLPTTAVCSIRTAAAIHLIYMSDSFGLSWVGLVWFGLVWFDSVRWAFVQPWKIVVLDIISKHQAKAYAKKRAKDATRRPACVSSSSEILIERKIHLELDIFSPPLCVAWCAFFTATACSSSTFLYWTFFFLLRYSTYSTLLDPQSLRSW